MVGIGADVRWPWPGKRIVVSMKVKLAWRQRAQRSCRRNGGGEGVIVFLIQSPFKDGMSEERIVAQ
jgi:hypothetical protein